MLLVKFLLFLYTLFNSGVYIAPTNAYFEDGKMKFRAKQAGQSFIPEMHEKFSGANYFDLDTKLLYIVIGGSEAVDVRMVPVVQVCMANDVIWNFVFSTSIDSSTKKEVFYFKQTKRKLDFLGFIFKIF